MPEWLDVTKIASFGILIMTITQYIKSYIPEKWIKLVTIGIGILVSILCECYIGGAINWIKAIVNGILAAVFADTGYSFLSGPKFGLPSKGNGKPPEPPKP